MSAEEAVADAAHRRGWSTAPVWSIATRVDRTGRADAELLSVYRDWGVVRKADRDDNFNVESDDLSTYKYVLPGDLVLNKMKTWQGSLAVSEFEGIVSPAYYVCTVSPQVHGRYLHYLLRSDVYVAMYGAASKGIRPNQWDLPFDAFRCLPVLLPPLEEQRRIADFLDDQVARIDELVRLRQRQLASVSDWRNSVLELLFRDAAKRPLDSYLLSAPCYGVLVPVFVEDGVPMIRIGDLDGIADGSATPAMISIEQSLEYRRTIVEAGDLLVSCVGSMGKSSLVSEGYIGSNLNRAVARLRPSDPDTGELLCAWVKTRAFLDLALLATGSGTAQPTLNMSDLRKFGVSLPDDRQAGAVRVREVSSEAAAYQRALEGSIALFNEHRRALITAAVTGELDVTTARAGVAV